jgi:Cu-processing system permease protein
VSRTGSAVLRIARHEFTLHSRNRWVVSFAILFAGLALAIAYFGMITSGYTGFQDFVRTSASLINLGGFLLPLFALLLGVFSFLTHREYLEVLATQPVSRGAILLGKYLGLLVSVLAAAALGFGLPGVVISLAIGVGGAGTYLLVVLFSCLLAAIFTGLSMVIALLSGRRPIALGVAISVWIFFELVYGLLMLATTLYLPPTLIKTVLLMGLAGNPVDVVRVLCLLQVGGPHLFGPAGATLIKLTGSATTTTAIGLAIVAAWIVVPLIIAIRVFQRQDL